MSFYHPDGVNDKYAGQAYEMQAKFPEPSYQGVLGAKTCNLRYLKDQSCEQIPHAERKKLTGYIYPSILKQISQS